MAEIDRVLQRKREQVETRASVWLDHPRHLKHRPECPPVQGGAGAERELLVRDRASQHHGTVPSDGERLFDFERDLSQRRMPALPEAFRGCLTDCKSAAGPQVRARRNQRFAVWTRGASRPFGAMAHPGLGCICGLGGAFPGLAHVTGKEVVSRVMV